jgi:transcriptional regulator GlxA family with amidase domain
MTTSPRIPPSARRIELLAFAGAQLLDVAGPLQVFASANTQALARGAAAPYRTAVVAPASPVVTSCGLALLVAPLPRPGTAVDTLLVAGGRGIAQAVCDAPLLRWFTARARRARRVGSVCTGAFMLGAAGLLDGRRAVTHWQDCDELARRFPRARVEVEPIFVHDGPVWSSAGVTAGIDLALAMVEADLGHDAAMAVARELVVFLKRPGNQAQFSSALALQQSSGRFDALHAWMAAHLHADLSVVALAGRAGMSERSFVRHYSAATGQTPARAVQRLRVEAARRLLATTRWPLKRIAQRCGFGSEETLRRSLLRQAQTTPRDYRARFAAAAPGR